MQGAFGHQHVEQLRALDVELGLAGWERKPSTKHDGYSLLTRICKIAVKSWLIPVSPFASVDQPPAPEPLSSSRAQAIDQAQQLMERLTQGGP